jgi:hypothetical protein
LRTRFGPEYDYTVNREGDRRKAEAELTRREESVKHLPIRELTYAERDEFTKAWRDEQARFVDQPAQAAASADALISRVMTARGYPVASYESQVEYASVDHGRVMNHYREAPRIAEQSRAGHASTEDLRRAMISFSKGVSRQLDGYEPNFRIARLVVGAIRDLVRGDAAQADHA